MENTQKNTVRIRTLEERIKNLETLLIMVIEKNDFDVNEEMEDLINNLGAEDLNELSTEDFIVDGFENSINRDMARSRQFQNSVRIKK